MQEAPAIRTFTFPRREKSQLLTGDTVEDDPYWVSARALRLRESESNTPIHLEVQSSAVSRSIFVIIPSNLSPDLSLNH